MERALEPSLSIGRLFGIQIRLSANLAIVFVLVMWTLSAGYFPAQQASSSDAVLWALATLGSLCFFGSVLVHELAHSVVALRHGIPVTRITLFILGGVAQIGREASTPRMEAEIAIAGPAASFVLTVLFASVYLLTAEALWPLATLCLWLAVVNGSLAVFNMIPGFPLDGGRVFRALVWSITGDYRHATRVSSLAGQGVAMLLVFYGFMVATSPGGMLLAGVWPAMVGFFIYNAAASSWRMVKLSEGLKQVTVENVMVRDVASVSAILSVQQFVDGYLGQQRHIRFPVLEGDHLLGTVGVEEVSSLPVDQREGTALGSLVRDLEQHPPLEPGERGDRALERFSEAGVEVLPVVEGDRLVGMLRREDLLGVVRALRA